MKYHWLLSFLGLCNGSLAIQDNPQARRLLELLHGPEHHSHDDPNPTKTQDRDTNTVPDTSFKFLSDKSSKYAVNGTAIPDVDFNVGESYAGLMPISKKNDETDNLYFWFFPTATEEFREKKEIVIWLNGGPGCSSLFGLMQENGPFLWQAGMDRPQRNPWAFNLLTNMVWVEQPVTTGFSKGVATIKDEDELAQQFLGFWDNFVETFGMGDFDVYIAAESYGGMYGPYISKHFIDDTKYNFKGLLIYDGLMFDRHVQTNIPLASYMEMRHDIWPFDDITRKRLHDISDRCKFTSYEQKYLQFPPSGPAPKLQQLPGGYTEVSEIGKTPRLECLYFFSTMINAIKNLNPCFSVYNVLDKCPRQFDPIMGAGIPWFEREDVKKAINAPSDVYWEPCRKFVFKTLEGDRSPPSGEHALPYVIDKTQNVIIAHGAMDFILPTNGVLLGIQNMTWGGKMGFQSPPKDPFFVPPYKTSPKASNMAPSAIGIVGTTHHERGLTFVVTQLAGHAGPGDSPAACFRHLEKLTGHIDSLSSVAPFTLPRTRDMKNITMPAAKGTVSIPCFSRNC